MLLDKKASSMTVSNDGKYLFFTRAGNLWAYDLSPSGDVYCPSTDYAFILNPSKGTMQRPGFNKTIGITGINQISGAEADREHDETSNYLLYVTSKNSHQVQKLQVDITNGTAEALVTIGTPSPGNNSGNAGTIAASSVKLSHPGVSNSSSDISGNIHVSSSSLWIGGKNQSIQQFDLDNLL